VNSSTTNISHLLKHYEDLIESNEQTIFKLQEQNQLLKSQLNVLLKYETELESNDLCTNKKIVISANNKRRKHQYPVKPDYENMSITQAIKHFLQQKGGLHRAENIIDEILSSGCSLEIREQAKECFYKALCRGHSDGKFSRPSYGLYGYLLN